MLALLCHALVAQNVTHDTHAGVNALDEVQVKLCVSAKAVERDPSADLSPASDLLQGLGEAPFIQAAAEFAEE